MDGKGPSSPRLAYRPESDARGLLIVGKGTMVDAMIAAQEGTRGRFLAAPAAAPQLAMRRLLSSEPAPAFVITAVIPEATRTRIKTEMLPELGDGRSEQRDIMNGVLSVNTAGAALVAGEGDGNAELRVELTCEGADACARVKALIEKKRLDWQKNFWDPGFLPGRSSIP